MSLEKLSDKKSIRSFVLRNGKLSNNKQDLFNKLMPLWSVPYTNQLIDINKLFNNENPIILDIGFGIGNTTIENAKSFPNYNFIAVDVYRLGVINLLKLIELNSIDNIRIIHYDIIDIVNNMLKENSLFGIHIFFPDPWHKKRHCKRRLIKESFIILLSKLLVVGGYIHIATDWEDYAFSILNDLNNCPNLINDFIDFAPVRANYRPITRFELKGKSQGHKIWDLIFRKKN